MADLDRHLSRPDVLALFELATGREPHLLANTRKEALLTEIRSAFDRKRLLLFEGWNFGGHRTQETGRTESHGTRAEKLAQRVMGTMGEIAIDGRRYRLVPARSWTPGPSATFRVVKPPEARAIVLRMLEHGGSARSDHQDLAQEVSALLSDRKGQGLLLLGYHPQAGGSETRPRSGPAVTPSQVREKIADLTWVEIEVVYEDGVPFEGNCLVELPDGRQTQGPPDEDGLIRIDGMRPGVCKVAFPGQDVVSPGSG